MIVIIDYGTGNTGSILNMIRKVGGEAIISSTFSEIESATALILPGVGAFDNAIKKFNDSGLKEVIEKRVLLDKIPFLGVCLGMQLLFETSEEGQLPGLGWIKGKVKRFDFSLHSAEKLKVPHMGWNIVRPVPETELFNALDTFRFYFVHTFHVCCPEEYVIGRTTYGYPFVCAVRKDNIWAVQFHPEKSHKFGIILFKNFLELLC